MESSIVVFASKKVGLEVLKFLLEKGYYIKGVVVADDQQEEMYNILDKFKIKRMVFNEKRVIEWLEGLGKIKWLINAWSPHYLCEKILNCFVHRVNIHPSYAPYCLGNDNAAWAIMENRSSAGGGAF